jgi:hypothetical protein
MRTLRDAGLSLRAIADQITAEGVKISHGGVKLALLAAADGPTPRTPAPFVWSEPTPP